MSCWFKDPSLFVEYYNNEIKLYRFNKNFRAPIEEHELTFQRVITNYTDLVDNSTSWRRSDFDNFAAFLYKYDLLVNCQGLALPITFPRDRGNGNQPSGPPKRYMSLEVVYLPRYGLPAHSVPSRPVLYMEGYGSAPVESSLKENELTAKLEASNDERDRIVQEGKDKNEALLKTVLFLENQITDLTSKLEKCCVPAEPWMSGSMTHGDWVPLEDLDVQKFKISSPLTITKTSSAPVFCHDDTTNVLASYFYRGLSNDGLVQPIVIVNPADLIPNGDKARFNADVWGVFINAGTLYVARKPTASEM